MFLIGIKWEYFFSYCKLNKDKIELENQRYMPITELSYFYSFFKFSLITIAQDNVVKN